MGFDEILHRYVQHAQTSPHNALIERPAMLRLLPDPKGKRILDLGTGSGFYAVHCANQGASHVVAVDSSASAHEVLKAQKTDCPIEFVQFDLGRGLPPASGRFDVVIASLVLHYVLDWTPFLSSLREALKPNGVFILSIGNPVADYLSDRRQNYFDEVLVDEYWRSFGATIATVHRSVESSISPFVDAGLILEALVEPKPLISALENGSTEEIQKLARMPSFLCMRWRLPA